MLDERYVAGLFDGEGYVTVNVWHKPNSIHVRYQVICGINMTYKPIIDMLVEDYGGKYFENRYDLRNANQRIGFGWLLASQKAYDFLKRIAPYLIVKKEQVDLCFKLQEHINAHRYGSGNQLRSHPLRDKLLAERNALADEIRALKKEKFSSSKDSGPKVSEASLTR